MNHVFVINSKDYSSAAEFGNVHGYVKTYYKIIKKLVPLSYKHTIKIVCDEASVCLFDNLPVTSIVMIENDEKRIEKYFEWDDQRVPLDDVTESKEQLKEFIRLTYPNAWKSVVSNLNTRFL